MENAPWLFAVDWPTSLPLMETTPLAPGAHPRPLMTVGCPGTSVMRLSWSVCGACPAGSEPRAAMLGPGGVCVITTVIPVLAESPVAPLATIVCPPGVVSDGNGHLQWRRSHSRSRPVEPRVTPWLKSVRVIDSSGTKFWPVTVKSPPGGEIEELVAITAPRGPSSGAGEGGDLPTQPDHQTGSGASHDQPTPHGHNPDCLPHLTVADNTNSR